MAYVEIHDNHGCKSVPDFVLAAVLETVTDFDNDNYEIAMTPYARRTAIAAALASKMNGEKEWRFCSCYRNENTPVHALVRALVSTVQANHEADKLAALAK